MVVNRQRCSRSLRAREKARQNQRRGAGKYGQWFGDEAPEDRKIRDKAPSRYLGTARRQCASREIGSGTSLFGSPFECGRPLLIKTKIRDSSHRYIMGF